jgi:hypothetical protein
MKRNLILSGSLLAMILLAVSSCKTPQTAQVVDNGSAPSESDRTVGTIRNTDDCGYYIEVFVGDVSHSYSPVNLDAKFQVDGMRIKFAYQVSATKPPQNCPNFEPVSVSDVTPLR